MKIKPISKHNKLLQFNGSKMPNNPITVISQTAKFANWAKANWDKFSINYSAAVSQNFEISKLWDQW